MGAILFFLACAATVLLAVKWAERGKDGAGGCDVG